MSGKCLGEQVLVLSDAKQQRRALPSPDEEVRLLGGDDADAVRALHLRESLPHRLLQRHPLLLPHVVDQVRDQLRVRVALDHIALALQFRSAQKSLLNKELAAVSRGPRKPDKGQEE